MIPTTPISTSRVQRSLRCFVCGKTRAHRLSYAACPRTAELIEKKLAAYTLEGRLVRYDGSPLPMTRNRGGVAAHLLASYNHPSPSPHPDLRKSQGFPHLEPVHPSRVSDPPIHPNPHPSRDFIFPTVPSIHSIPTSPARHPPHHSPSHATKPHIPGVDKFPLLIFEILVGNTVFRRQLALIIAMIDRLETQRGTQSLAEYLAPVRAHFTSLP
ncbi:hypothetical protein R3P38DRAFT_3241462 [Favolaschia claudopus]|uniref:Uncharacterized protein n=1 Tax=Favolaschia claudopus TaxID=2862362 RepID=A0AAV9Z5S9_9AGAR